MQNAYHQITWRGRRFAIRGTRHGTWTITLIHKGRGVSWRVINPPMETLRGAITDMLHEQVVEPYANAILAFFHDAKIYAR